MGRLCPGLQPNVAEVRENNPLYRFGCGVPDENAVANQELLSSTDAISHRFIAILGGTHRFVVGEDSDNHILVGHRRMNLDPHTFVSSMQPTRQ